MKRTTKSKETPGSFRMTVEPAVLNAADYPAALRRVIAAARKGGASEADVLTVMTIPAFTQMIVGELQQKRRKRIENILSTNSKPTKVTRKDGRTFTRMPVTPPMREHILKLNGNLIAEFPADTTRFREIERITGTKQRTVRKIVTGT